MASNPISIPLPVLSSSLHASSDDQAETANTLSHGRLVWVCLVSCILWPFRSCLSWYQLRAKLRMEEDEHLRSAYANVKGSKDLPGKWTSSQIFSYH